MADPTLFLKWKPEVGVGGQKKGGVPLGSGVPRGQDEEGTRVGVQPVGNSRKNLVFMVCLLYTQTLRDPPHSKLRRTPAACCGEGCSTCPPWCVPSTQPAQCQAHSRCSVKAAE